MFSFYPKSPTREIEESLLFEDPLWATGWKKWFSPENLQHKVVSERKIVHEERFPTFRHFLSFSFPTETSFRISPYCTDPGTNEVSTGGLS